MRTALAFLAACLLVAPPAHAAHFGKNKVQYKSFHWRVLETPHFQILFYDREAAVVQDAARLAERSYARLSACLKHEFKRRIPLVLYASHSDFQQTNITESMIDLGTGGVTELARRRVFLPFTGSYAELEHVLTHEMVHAFELDILLDPEATTPASPFGYMPPLWVMEGLAEYLSLGAHDTHTDMWVRDACLSGSLLSLDRLEYAHDIRVYRFGQSVWEFFAAEYGTERIGDLLRAMREHRDLDRALQTVAKVSLAELSERWGTSMRRRYLPDIAAHQTTREFAVPVATRRTEGASMLLAPNISPDGERLVYVSDQRLNHDLYVRDIKTLGAPRRLVEGETRADFEALRFFSASTAWSPDGSTLAFSAKAGAEDALYLMEVARGRIVGKHTFGLDEVQTATFSPDGQDIVFVGLSGGESDLYRVRHDGSDLRRLTHDRCAERDPQWSPDGRSILYVSDEGAETDFAALRYGRMHLMLLDLESGTRRDITPFQQGKAVSPAWSGDGEYVAFVSDRDGISNVYILHLPTGAVFRLTDAVTGISGMLPTSTALSWARRTQRLLLSVFSDSGWDVYRIDDPLAVMRPIELEPGEVTPTPAVSAAGSGASGEMRAGSELTRPEGVEDRPLAASTAASNLVPSQAALAATEPPGGASNAAGANGGRETAGRATAAALHVPPPHIPGWETPGDARETLESAAAADSAPGGEAARSDSVRVASAGAADSFRVRDYRPRLTPDLSSVGGVVGYEAGVGGQSQLHFSDLLGNHNLSVGFGIYGSLKDSDLYLAYLNRAQRTNYALSAFQFRKRYGVLGSRQSVDVEHQTYRGLQVAALRPFDKFSRLEGSLQLAGVAGRYYLGQTTSEAESDPSIQEMKVFVGPGLAYVQDSAVFGWTGPIKGRRMRLSVEGALGEIRFATLEADLRQYWNVRKWYAVAARLYAATSHGNTPQTLYLGGAQSLRGYDYGALVGNHALLGSVEFRFPMVRHLALGWPLPLELGNIQGALFGDAATAWDGEPFRTSRAVRGETVGRAPQLAYGFGMRFNLGYMVLKLDWAQRCDTGTGRRSPGANISLGADF